MTDSEPEHGQRCKGKRRHVTSASALVHLQRLADKGDAGLVVYQCHKCHGFHVGHYSRAHVDPDVPPVPVYRRNDDVF